MGVNCKYNGKNNYSEKLAQFLKDKNYICVCPEVEGGLPVPRNPVVLDLYVFQYSLRQSLILTLLSI